MILLSHVLVLITMFSLYFQRKRTGELTVQAGWKNYNLATQRYEWVPNKKKSIKVDRASTIQVLTTKIADEYFPDGWSEDGTNALSSLEYFIAKDDGKDMPEDIEGTPFTFEHWRQLPEIKYPIRLYLHTKVTETSKFNHLYH